MRLNTSYTVRGVRVSRTFSYPDPSLADIERIESYVSWLERQEGARVEVE